MSRAVSGLYTLPAGNPVTTGTTITTTWANTTLTDIADTLSDSLSRSGKGSMTAALHGVDGNLAAPGFAFASETSLGIYRAAPGVLAASGALLLPSGTEATPALRLGSVGFFVEASALITRFDGINGPVITDNGINQTNEGSGASYILSPGTCSVRGNASYLEVKSSSQGLQLDAPSGLCRVRSMGAFPLRFDVNTSERMRLDTNGSLLVGHTSSSAAGRVAATAMPGFNPVSGADNWKLAALQGREALGGGLSLVDSAGNGHAMWTDAGILVIRQGFNGGTASVNGVALGSGATAWTSASDIRLKTILEPIQGAVAKLSSLRTVIGRYKTDPEGTRRPFLVAQDVQSVLPEAVDVIDAEGHLGLRYTELIPLIIAAINELQAQS